jgi:hypothetical protein
VHGAVWLDFLQSRIPYDTFEPGHPSYGNRRFGSCMFRTSLEGACSRTVTFSAIDRLLVNRSTYNVAAQPRSWIL